jgi:excisionase family DNA binding protein
MDTTNDRKPLAVSVPEAGRLLGVGRITAYRAAKAGRLPTVRFGRRLVVPVRALEKMLEQADKKGRGRQ